MYMATITDSQILKEATDRLAGLFEEEKEAEAQKIRRDLAIQKAKAVIELFSDDSLETPVTLSINTDKSIDVDNSETKLIFVLPSGTWQEKIKACLKFKNRALSIAQMVDLFKPFNMGYADKQLTAVLSNTVNTMLKKLLLKTYVAPIKMKGYFYGNPLWFDGDVLKEEYKPDLRENLLW
jgi:hypothetical protein